jgi:SOS-response transcriptional repressor LexA
MSDQFGGITKIQAGAYLRDKRLEKGVKDRQSGYLQREVAEAIGLPQVNTMTYYESGRIDWRKGDYAERIIEFLGITPAEALEKLGMRMLVFDQKKPDAPIIPPDARAAPMGVQIRHLGLVQAMMQISRGSLASKGVQRHRFVTCPLPAASKYNPDDLYVLDVDGDSMTCPEVQRSIPAGSSMLFHGKLEPRNGKIVAAWLPSVGRNGLGVLKVFRRKETEGVVLESYNPSGARYPAQQYPDMIVQGVCLGYWMDMPY